MPHRIESYTDKLARCFPLTLEEIARGKSSAKNVTFQVTDDCNLKCTYCYQINKGHHKMPLDIAKKFIDILLHDETEYINQHNSGGIILDFIGGEPFLEIELIDQIIDYFVETAANMHHPWATRYRVSLCSNGVLYFDPKVQEFLKKHKDHLSLNITVDGNKKLHDSCRLKYDGSGSYDDAIAAVQDWASRGYVMGSKMTLAPQNIEYAFEAVQSLIENGYGDINLNCVFEEGWTSEHATILYYQLKQIADYLLENNLEDTHRVSMFEEIFFSPMDPLDDRNWCGGTGAMTAVDWKGDIYPCLRYMESSLGADQKPMIIGNVFDGFMSKPCEKECVECLQAITRRSQSTDECFYCPIGKGCAWCSAYNYQVFGTANRRATFICEMHKARALANIYYWNKYYLKTKQNKVFKNYVPDDWSLKIISEEELNILKQLEER